VIPSHTINLTTEIEIDDKTINFEIFTIEKGLIKAIKLNNNVFVLNNGFKQGDKTIIQLPRKKKRGRPKQETPPNKRILLEWIAKKGKQVWNINDFLKDNPKFERNKNRLEKMLSDLIIEHKLIQLDNASFRVNV